ncbi:MAG: OmpA family protein [Pseudomonadota bacterium]
MTIMKFATVIALAAFLTPDIAAFAQSSDQSKLQRQREQLIKQRQQQGGSRTLQEITPASRNEEKAAKPSGGTVVSPSSTPQTAAKKKKKPAPQVARAETPPIMAPEDQLFKPIEFAYDSANLTQTARGTLDGLCETLKLDLNANPGSSYYVIGHTDASGSAGYNARLSQRRADATKQYLVGSCGIATAQLKAVGMGEERLLAALGPDAAGQRRVEIQVRDTGG